MDGHIVRSQDNNIKRQICSHEKCKMSGFGHHKLNDKTKPQTMNVKIDVSAVDSRNRKTLTCSTPTNVYSHNSNNQSTVSSEHINCKNQSTDNPGKKRCNNQSADDPENKHYKNQSNDNPENKRCNNQSTDNPENKCCNNQSADDPENKHCKNQSTDNPENKCCNNQSADDPENKHYKNQSTDNPENKCCNNQSTENPKNKHYKNQSTHNPENERYNHQSTSSRENKARNDQSTVFHEIKICNTQNFQQNSVTGDIRQQEGVCTTNHSFSQPEKLQTNGISSFANVCANFTAYMTKNTVSVSVNDKKSNALCDTGASVSCISKHFFDKAFPNVKPNINPCHIKSIVGVGGTHHPVLGVVLIDVKFGTLGLSYPFYVVEDLHHSLILGHDFMETHSVTLDIKGKKMIIHDNVKVCSLRTNTGYARTVKPIKLPANSEIDIPVKIARVSTNDEVLLEPLSSLANESILGAKCLIKVNKGKSVMRLANLSESDVQLRGNKVLAVVSQVEKAHVFTLNDSESSHSKTTEQNNITRTPSEFSFDLQHSDLNEQQKEKLLSFLHANNGIFSEGLHDLGKTHLVQHHVDTGDAPPVKLPPYKQTPNMRRITHEYVEDYKRNGLIKESNSNWHSPVVLVKKANSDEYRFAVDYRKLNKISKSQAYPIPRLSDIFDAIGEANAHFFHVTRSRKGFLASTIK